MAAKALRSALGVRATIAPLYTGGAVALSPDGTRLYCPCGDDINVISLPEGQLVRKLKSVRLSASSNQSQFLAARGSRDCHRGSPEREAPALLHARPPGQAVQCRDGSCRAQFQGCSEFELLLTYRSNGRRTGCRFYAWQWTPPAHSWLRDLQTIP